MMDNMTLLLTCKRSVSSKLTPRMILQINKRFMFTYIKRRLCRNTSNMNIKNYTTSFAGKEKFVDKYSSDIDKNNFNIHTQFYTDFNFIYDNVSEAKIFLVGILVTKFENKTTMTISENTNIDGYNKSQKVVFFETAKEIKSEFLIHKNSFKYFQDNTIKITLEQNKLYKDLKQKILEELRKANINVREADEQEQLHKKTGFYDYMKKCYPELDINELLSKQDFSKFYKIKDLNDK